MLEVFILLLEIKRDKSRPNFRPGNQLKAGARQKSTAVPQQVQVAGNTVVE
jgi:hypothetical protein